MPGLEIKLAIVRARFVFLQSYKIAMSRPRIEMDLASSLHSDAHDVLNTGVLSVSDASDPTPLSEQLGASIREAIAYLQEIIEEARQASSGVSADLFEG